MITTLVVHHEIQTNDVAVYTADMAPSQFKFQTQMPITQRMRSPTEIRTEIGNEIRKLQDKGELGRTDAENIRKALDAAETADEAMGRSRD